MRLLLLSASLLAFGCKPAPQVARYEAKPDAAPAPASTPAAPVAAQPAPAAAAAAAAPMVAPPSMKAEAASFDAPKWGKLPAGWAVGPENAMRKATWIVTGPDGSKAEVAVTVFPGNVGGLTANVNRWRGQIGLSSATAEEIAASAKPAKVGGVESQRFVMASADGKKGLDAVMTPHKGATWFFKMSGDAAAVAAQGPALVAFLAESQLP
jgi:hypothetical protein